MSIAKLQKQYQQAQHAYVAGKRTPAHLRKIEALRKRLLKAEEASELKTLGARTRKPRAAKNFFGLGKGTPVASVERQRRSEAHRLLDRGEYRQARKVSRMSTRKYARKHGMKVEGRLRAALRQRKEQTRKRVHGLVDRAFGQNPAGLLPAVVEGLAIGSGIVASEKALEALSKKKAAGKNPLPALLSALAPGAEWAAGEALGTQALKSVEGLSPRAGTKRRPMKKKKAKKKAAKRPRPKKKAGHNPKRSHTKRPKAKRKAARVTHAVAVRGKIVDMGTHAQMKAKARNLRRVGLKAIIGKRAH